MSGLASCSVECGKYGLCDGLRFIGILPHELIFSDGDGDDELRGRLGDGVVDGVQIVENPVSQFFNGPGAHQRLVVGIYDVGEIGGVADAA